MIHLPIESSLARIVDGLSQGGVVVVAPPGTGKTTRVPVAILESGLLKDHPNIAVLQPRRVAARSAAARVAFEQGFTIGREVGFQVRYERRYGDATRIRFLTEGILTRQILADPFLETIGAVVLDEFHERNLNSDIALALLREIQREVRPDLRIAVMSATLDAEPISRYLGGCPIVRVEARAHPISIEYRPATRPSSADTLAPLIDELVRDATDAGDILVFLPGMAEIRSLCRRLEPTARSAGLLVLPLHGSLPADDQDRVFRPDPRRKVIVSTNIAETSLTIDGVKTVVDSGLARIVRFDARRGLDRWELARISRASAAQRAGRAGRTGPGRAIRLWSEREERALPEFDQPEIDRVDLSATVLALHAWGVTDPEQFGWYERPSLERLAAAERLLILLGALAGNPARITPLGREILELPVHPRLARLIVAARACDRVHEGATLAALLAERDIKLREGDSESGKRSAANPQAASSSDILDRMDLLAEAEAARFGPSLRSRGIDPTAARQVVTLRDDLIRRDRGHRSRGVSQREHAEDEMILEWLLLAYPDRVVKMRGAERTGLMVGGRGARLGPESAVRDAELFLAIDAREERRGAALAVQVSLASLIRMEWLERLFPDVVRRERTTFFDEKRQRVVTASRLYYHDLPLREDIEPSVDRERSGAVLAAELRPRAASVFESDPRASKWLARYEFVRTAVPELGWPQFDAILLGELLEQVCEEKTEVAQVEKSDLSALLESRLDYAMTRELRESAPLSITIPSGRVVTLQYEPGRPPVLAAKLQEFFGWTETPRLARGRVPVLLHLLGPNQRPVQITDDLNSFWKTTYHQVRKDLRGRYPKHPWPEDPLTAQPPARGQPR
jgi:ATP-dependent helicase HrpB